MKKVQAYEALDGSIHKKKADAAFASIIHIGATKNKDSRGNSIDGPAVAFIIENRAQIAAILQHIDADEAEGV
jgi:hypothetical protein